MAAEDPVQDPSGVPVDDSSEDDGRARGLGIALLAALAALLILWWIFLQTTVVPNVIGMPQARAERVLEDAGLVVGEVTEVNSTQHPAGSVADQSPFEGARVLKKSRVDLAVAVGGEGADEDGAGDGSGGFDYPLPEDAADERRSDGGGGTDAVGGPWVPNVQAETERTAVARLRAAGYRVTVKYGPITSGPGKGRVHYQRPEPDAAAPRGTVVEIWISTGGPGGSDDSERPYAQPGD